MAEFFKFSTNNLGDLSRSKTVAGSFGDGADKPSGKDGGGMPKAEGNVGNMIVDAGKVGTGGDVNAGLVKKNVGGLPS